MQYSIKRHIGIHYALSERFIAIFDPNRTLFNANAILVFKPRPPFFREIRPKRKGVVFLPLIPTFIDFFIAPVIIGSISFIGISCSKGTGFPTKTA